MTWGARTPFQYTGPGPVTTDPMFAYVSLLLHFDGTNGASTFTDNSSYARGQTLIGTPTNDTSTYQFPTASGKFVSASSQALAYAATTNPIRPFLQNAGEAIYSTLECWIKTTSSTAYMTIISQMDGAFNNGAWSLLMNSSYSGEISFSYRPYNTGSPPMLTTASGVYNDGAWHHVAVTYGGGTFTLWVDGVSKATRAFTASATVSTTNMWIGGDNFFGRYFNGNIDELRITRSDTNAGGNVGTCRYTAPFTPTGPFPNS